MGFLTSLRAGAIALALAAAGCAAPGDRPAATAAPAATLAVRDLDGRTHDLDAALGAGETVALIFWQTWCKPCEREAPAIVEAARAHGGRIRFVGVVSGRDGTVDDAEVRAVAARWSYGFPQVRDRDLSLARRFDVEGTPTVIVLGQGASIRYRGHRPPDDWTPFEGCKDGVCPLPTR